MEDDKKIAVYMRVSSRMQAEANGVESQRHAIKGWFQMKGIDYGSSAVEFVDLAKSGKSMDREAWNRMMEGVRAGEFSEVVVYDLSRCGRTASGISLWIEEMTGLETGVVFIKDGLDISTAVGRMVARVMAAVGELDREQRNERIADGQKAFYERGGRPGNEHPSDVRLMAMRMFASGANWKEAQSAIASSLGVEVCRATLYKFRRLVVAADKIDPQVRWSMALAAISARGGGSAQKIRKKIKAKYGVDVRREIAEWFWSEATRLDHKRRQKKAQ